MVDYPLIYVVDTSLFIDLYVGRILVEFFNLPHRFVAPDVIIAELREPSSEILVALGLQEGVLTGHQIQEVARLEERYRRPSFNDLFALVLAKLLEATLLTSDGDLRKAAQQEGVPTHGTLWVLDEIVRLQIVSRARAANALRLMCKEERRLPQDECDKRLREWMGE